MNDAKIQLSAEELQLVQNAGWLLTKNKIADKVFVLFGDIAHTMQENIAAQPAPLPAEVLVQSPKISKGENYKGLPYIMLDYPRFFDKENIFAIRVLFWWGNFFSITLHLKGRYKKQFIEHIIKNVPLLQQYDFYVCNNGDEWRHEFEEDNYTSLKLSGQSFIQSLLLNNDFCKVSAKIPLQQWNEAKAVLTGLHRVLLKAAGYN